MQELEKTNVSLVPVAQAAMPEFKPVEQDDTIRLPRLVLLQGGRNNAMIQEGYGVDGDLLNTLSKENYGKSIEIIPLCQLEMTRIRWRARTTGGGILCIARDGRHGQGDPGDMIPGNECSKCTFFNIRRSKDPSDDQWCSANYGIISLVRSTKEPVMLVADSVKPSDQGIRDMLGMARQNRFKGIRMFQKSYVISVKEAEANGYAFFKLACSPGNNNGLLPEDEAGWLREQSEFFLGSRVTADMSDGQKGEGIPF